MILYAIIIVVSLLSMSIIAVVSLRNDLEENLRLEEWTKEVLRKYQ